MSQGQKRRTMEGGRTMANADFEVRQLLRAYRKGLISDELFEAQIGEVQNVHHRYASNGKVYATEREMILAVLDEFRCAERFASEYLARWIEVSDQACVKGGLRTVQQREAFHAQLLEARLCELEGTPQCTVPALQRKEQLAFYSSTDKGDLEKLQSLSDLVKDADAILKPITEAVDCIQDDEHTRELLTTIIDDERSTIRWLLAACETLSGDQRPRG